jgi:hypothetical protein
MEIRIRDSNNQLVATFLDNSLINRVIKCIDLRAFDCTVKKSDRKSIIYSLNDSYKFLIDKDSYIFFHKGTQIILDVQSLYHYCY